MIDPRFYSLRKGGLSVGELCARLDIAGPDGSLADAVVERPAKLADSGAGDVVFLEGRKSLSALESARATACFVPDTFAKNVADAGILPIVTASPKFHLSRATTLLVEPVTEGGTEIDPSATIHPSTVIGAGVRIGANVTIGAHCVITHTIIGDGCEIGSCTVIGGTGFGVVSSATGDVLSVPHVGRVVLDENVRVGSNCCIDRGQLGDTTIGAHTKIDNLVQIAHNCVVGQRCVMAGCVGLSGSCIVGDDVQMGGRVGLADHVSVGNKARLAAFAGVMHDVPAGETWSGIPAVPIREHMKMVAHTRRAVRR